MRHVAVKREIHVLADGTYAKHTCRELKQWEQLARVEWAALALFFGKSALSSLSFACVINNIVLFNN